MELRSTNTTSVFRYLDWVTVTIYVLLVFLGAVSIYAASYDFDHASIFAFEEFSGKQLRWIGLALLASFVILLTDFHIYEAYAYPIYGLLIILLVITIFVAPDINGSRSWLVLGPMSLQPAEFSKFATALALAKLFSSYNFRLNLHPMNYVKALFIIFLPIALILAQKETGSALAYMALFFVLYREGMSGLVLTAALCAVVFFVTTVKYVDEVMLDLSTGELVVFVMIQAGVVVMTAIYCKLILVARNLLLWFLATDIVVTLLSVAGVSVSGQILFGVILCIALLYLAIVYMARYRNRSLLITIGAALLSVAFLFSVNKVFTDVLQPHQQQRIKVSLGIEEDLRGAGYNVNQSKIAIGSGGFSGKGFLNGTQTKLKYVPEQHTDFIFCTIGEEKGFIGSAAVLILFLILIFRVLAIAERQPTTFARVYGYCVASYFIFHVSVNVGMVIGLCPVIGIPLPFFSYGGSSLWGFTFLLFILLRLDASRREHLSY